MSSPGTYAEQAPKGGVGSVLDDIRRAVHAGRFIREEWDPNHPKYAGSHTSNKRVGMAAHRLLGRPPIDSDEMWSVVIRAAIGPNPNGGH